MKNLMKFLGIAALAAVTSFSMIACDNGGGPGNNPGNDPQRVTYTGRNGSDTYTLVITENTSRAYTPVNGDTYKLTVTGGKTSTGTIVISGGTITLTPSKDTGTITVEVLGTSIVSITGTGLRWDDDTVFIAPGTLSNRTVGNPYLGKKLVLSGQVYVEKWSEDGFSVSYEKFDGDLELSSLYNGGGIGEVKGGQLSFIIETPTDLRTPSEEFGSSGGNIKFSDDTVKIFILELGRYSDSSSPLLKENITTNVVGNTASLTQEQVTYVYVDGDVTLSGGGKFDLPDDIFDVDATLNDFSLPLKEGWNVTCMKWEQSGTFTGSNVTSDVVDITCSLGEPSGLKWVKR